MRDNGVTVAAASSRRFRMTRFHDDDSICATMEPKRILKANVGCGRVFEAHQIQRKGFQSKDFQTRITRMGTDKSKKTTRPSLLLRSVAIGVIRG